MIAAVIMKKVFMKKLRAVISEEEGVNRIMRIICRSMVRQMREEDEYPMRQNAPPLADISDTTEIKKKKKAILTEEDVIKIRQLSAKGYSSTQLATVFPCCARNIRAIVQGKIWKNVKAH